MSAAQHERLVELRSQLHGGAQEKLPALSSALAIAHTADKGRQLVAAADVPAGALVVVDVPYASALRQESQSDKCHACYTRIGGSGTPVSCSQYEHCQHVYCSTACSEWHSSQGQHAWMCPWLFQLLDGELEEYSNVLVAVTAVLRCGTSDWAGGLPADDAPDVSFVPDQLLSDDDCGRLVASFVTHVDQLSQVQLVDVRKTAQRITQAALEHRRSYFGENSGWPTEWSVEQRTGRFEELLLTHLLRVPCNCLQFSLLHDNTCHVTGLYCTATLFNHSCQPNVEFVFSDRGTLECRTLTKLTAGTELCTCYGPQIGCAPTAERRARLRAQFHFDCACRACTSDARAAIETQADAYRCTKCAHMINMPGADESASPSLLTCASCSHLLNRESVAHAVGALKQLLRAGGTEPDRFTELIAKLHAVEQQLDPQNTTLNALRATAAAQLLQSSAAAHKAEAVRLLRAHAQTSKRLFGSASIKTSLAILQLANAYKQTKSQQFWPMATLAVHLHVLHYGVAHTKRLYNRAGMKHLIPFIGMLSLPNC